MKYTASQSLRGYNKVTQGTRTPTVMGYTVVSEPDMSNIQNPKVLFSNDCSIKVVPYKDGTTSDIFNTMVPDEQIYCGHHKTVMNQKDIEGMTGEQIKELFGTYRPQTAALAAENLYQGKIYYAATCSDIYLSSSTRAVLLNYSGGKIYILHCIPANIFKNCGIYFESENTFVNGTFYSKFTINGVQYTAQQLWGVNGYFVQTIINISDLVPEQIYKVHSYWLTRDNVTVIGKDTLEFYIDSEGHYQKQENTSFELKQNLSDFDEIAEYIIAWSNRPIEDILTDLEESEAISASNMEQEETLLGDDNYNGLTAGDITGSDIEHPSGGENRYIVEKNGYRYTYLPEYGIVFIEEALS